MSDINQNNPVVLEPTYDCALIGHSVSYDKAPRFCYSLTTLARREEARSNCSPERAREIIWDLIQELTKTHGDQAPMFIDDAASRDELPASKSLIVLP